MIRTIAIAATTVVALPLAGVLAVAATKPDTFSIQRTTTIKAPAEKIFATLNDFQAWGAWSPYETKDPAMKRTFSGARDGKGAVYEWAGDHNVGKGRLEITDASAPSKLTVELQMFEPCAATNTVEFTLEPHGDATIVTWAMKAPTPFMAKIVHVFIDVERMVGNDFEAGLANLKSLSERPYSVAAH